MDEIMADGHEIKELRCDCAPEIIADQMAAIMEEFTIIYNRSPPGTPAPNGPVERPIGVLKPTVIGMLNIA